MRSAESRELAARGEGKRLGVVEQMMSIGRERRKEIFIDGLRLLVVLRGKRHSLA